MDYITKHSPVDDYRYLSYTSQADGTPDLVTNVTVAPLSVSVAKGGNTTFAAKVVGSGDYPEGVTWKLDVESGGTIASGTSISSTGKLTVASGQGTTKKLYVSAVAANGIESVAAVVTVTSS